MSYLICQKCVKNVYKCAFLTPAVDRDKVKDINIYKLNTWKLYVFFTFLLI